METLLYSFLVLIYCMKTYGSDIRNSSPKIWSSENVLTVKEKSILRYGFHRTQECQNYDSAYLCIRKCLDLNFDIANADKNCVCTCYNRKDKAKYTRFTFGNPTKWKIGAPTTSKPVWAQSKDKLPSPDSFKNFNNNRAKVDEKVTKNTIKEEATGYAGDHAHGVTNGGINIDINDGANIGTNVDVNNNAKGNTNGSPSGDANVGINDYTTSKSAKDDAKGGAEGGTNNAGDGTAQDAADLVTNGEAKGDTNRGPGDGANVGSDDNTTGVTSESANGNAKGGANGDTSNVGDGGAQNVAEDKNNDAKGDAGDNANAVTIQESNSETNKGEKNVTVPESVPAPGNNDSVKENKNDSEERLEEEAFISKLDTKP